MILIFCVMWKRERECVCVCIEKIEKRKGGEQENSLAAERKGPKELALFDFDFP